MNADKVLILLRGLPGAGKSTFAGIIPNAENFAADDYPELYEGGFHPVLLPQAHRWCQDCVRNAMIFDVPLIAVHNTLTTEREMKPYFDLAKEFGYTVVSLIVENRHGNASVHNVPEHVMNKMEDRFNVKLR